MTLIDMISSMKAFCVGDKRYEIDSVTYVKKSPMIKDSAKENFVVQTRCNDTLTFIIDPINLEVVSVTKGE